MMKNRRKRALAAVLGAVLLFEPLGRAGFLTEYPETAYAEGRQATVNATTLNVRSGPGTNTSIVKRLDYGTAVSVLEEKRGSDGVVWYKIRFTSGNQTMDGYASSAYIKFPVSYSYDAEFERYLSGQGFPESYKDSLRTLHAEHPSWVFQAQNTGLDWNDVMKAEGAVAANLVATGAKSSWKSIEYGAYDWGTGRWTGFDGASWVAASKEIVAYYMDPRNFLNDTYVFQFLLHTYDANAQTREGLQSLVSGTFLEKQPESTQSAAPGTGEGQTPGTGNNGGQGTGNNGAPGTENNGGQNPGAGSNVGPGQSGGPGSGNGSTGTEAPVGPGFETPSAQTEAAPADGNGIVSTEGPTTASVSRRETVTVGLPNVEYGPGMDSSAITGDDTGAAEMAPIPTGQSYVDIIMNAAAQSGVNPYVIGAMILQEQGSGKSGSISGKTAGYEGYYNFFNVGAYDTGDMSAITRGLWYASQSGSYGRPWNSIEKSIVGGSLNYSDNYLKRGQDTFYLKKFNVQGDNLYKHQYMTNIEGAAGEGAKLSRAYTTEMKKQALVFKIPVFRNMPETACAKPTVDGSPNNKLSSLEVNGYVLTPTFSRDQEKYDIIVNPSVGTISVSASAIDSKAVVSGTGNVNLQSGNNTVSVQVKAENGSVRTYQLNVVRQSDAPVVNVNNGSGNINGPGTNVGPGQVTGPGGSDNSNSGGNGGPGAPTETETQPSSGQKPGTGTIPDGASGTGKPATATRPAAEGQTPAGTGNGTENGQAPAGTGSQIEAGKGPAGTAPAETKPAVTAPAETKPAATAPAETKPAATAPAETKPAATKPAETKPAATKPAETQAATLKSGDANGDGSVSILDVMLIRKHVLGETTLSGSKAKAADINGDGKITSADADALQKKLLKN